MTIILTVTFFPPEVPVMIAAPSLTALTFPDFVTVAMEELLDFQVIGCIFLQDL